MTFMRHQKLGDTAHGAVARIVTGTGVPVESAPLVDNVVLDDALVAALYASDVWAAAGIELLDFGGGESGISLPMVVEIDEALLKNVKLGKRTLGLKRARELKEACAAALAQEPHY